MSRAIDEDIAESISKEQGQRACHEITQFFDAHRGETVEIEILSRGYSLPPDSASVQDGNCIGVSKMALVHAFIAARQSLFNCLRTRDKLTKYHKVVMSSTVVVLLLDAEHLTAANSRKMVLLELKQLFEGLGDVESAARLFWDELAVSQSFLTSPLHRHTKSPT